LIVMNSCLNEVVVELDIVVADLYHGCSIW